MTESADAKNNLENTVKDAYMIYAESSGLSADEQQQRYRVLLQKAEALQQQYGSEKITYRKFEYAKAIAAVIKQPEIVEALIKEGYAVKPQGRFSI